MSHEKTNFWPWLLDYTVFFFGPEGAPVSHWHKYFASCRRVWIAIRETEKIRDDCSDIYEWGVRREEIVRDLELRLNNGQPPVE